MDWRGGAYVSFPRISADLWDEEVDSEWRILVYQEALGGH